VRDRTDCAVFRNVIEADPGVGELRHVGLADDDRTSMSEPDDGVGVDRRGGRIGQHA